MLQTSLLTLFAIALLAYGFAVGKWQVFPYSLLAAAKQSATGQKSYTRVRALQFAEFQPEADVTLVGDSIFEGGLWSEAFPGVVVANRGVGGDTTAKILARMDQIKATTPDRVIMMVGINDIFYDVPISETLSNYERIAADLEAAGASIIVLSTMQCAKGVSADHHAKVTELNGGLRALTERRGWTYLNINKTMAGKEGLRAEYTYDGYHLTGKGYAALADAIAPFIRGEH